MPFLYPCFQPRSLQHGVFPDLVHRARPLHHRHRLERRRGGGRGWRPPRTGHGAGAAGTQRGPRRTEDVRETLRLGRAHEDVLLYFSGKQSF